MQIKNRHFLLGFSVPILMMTLGIISIYLPSFATQPQFQFLYACGNNDVCDQQHLHEYLVKDGKLLKNEIDPALTTLQQGVLKLYIYNVEKKTST